MMNDGFHVYPGRTASSRSPWFPWGLPTTCLGSQNEFGLYDWIDALVYMER